MLQEATESRAKHVQANVQFGKSEIAGRAGRSGWDTNPPPQVLSKSLNAKIQTRFFYTDCRT